MRDPVRRAEYNREYQAKNAEALRAAARERAAKKRAADPAGETAKVLEWRRRNRKHYLATKRAQTERSRARKGLPPARNPKHDAHVKAWKKIMSRVEKLCCSHVTVWARARAGDYWRHKYRTDAEFNAREKVRARLRKLGCLDAPYYKYMSSSVKAGKFAKGWASTLGYSLADLVRHLRRTLPKGASWADFLSGRLHIDHIVPRSHFDLTSPDEVRACWALSNLRLLSARRNLAKGSARTHLL